MTPIQEIAIAQIQTAIVCRDLGMSTQFRSFMKGALGSINQIESIEIRKAAAKQWFRAYNLTNNQLKARS